MRRRSCAAARRPGTGRQAARPGWRLRLHWHARRAAPQAPQDAGAQDGAAAAVVAPRPAVLDRPQQAGLAGPGGARSTRLYGADTSPRNPAALAKAPRLPEADVEPYSVDEVRLLLQSAVEGRNGARWAVALALGLRQGEALGLRWDDVDLDAGTLLVRRGRLRPCWEHGCNGTCGRKFGGYCPNRVALRDETAETKSRAGRRHIGLPDQLVELLRTHRAEQDRERVEAAELWTDGGWLFARPTGTPLNPRTDWTDWKKLLNRAGVRDGRLHDARHTAATVLLLLGVPERAVMGVMGWSNTAMAARYQHVTAAVQRDIAGRVGGLIWQASGEPADDN